MTVWQAGMRCVFVREYDAYLSTAGFELPVKGRVYTVREVLADDPSGELALRLYEISNAHMIGRIVGYRRASGETSNMRIIGEPVFEAYRFRPLSETRLDIFRAMLAPRDKVDA